MYIKLGETIADSYADDIIKVMAKLEGILVSGVTGMDAQAVLNSRPVMIQALRDAGYNDLANKTVAKYPDIIAASKKAVRESVKFTTPAKGTFAGLARADLEAFMGIGTKAMDDLRLGLYRQVVSNRPFADLVESIRAATVGVDKKGSPLANHAYTHANTAAQSFQGEVLREIGEELGAEDWEVVGPDDAVTRDVCSAALSEPVRTEKEWIAADYWGGSPGGWNCRHQLFPVLA